MGVRRNNNIERRQLPDSCEGTRTDTPIIHFVAVVRRTELGRRVSGAALSVHRNQAQEKSINSLKTDDTSSSTAQQGILMTGSIVELRN